MSENTLGNEVKQPAQKRPSIGRFTLVEVDAALADCEKTIKACSDTVKAKLSGNSAIPPKALRDLSQANAQKGRLVMRRITLLMEMGDTVATELLDKLMKVKPAKVG